MLRGWEFPRKTRDKLLLPADTKRTLIERILFVSVAGLGVAPSLEDYEPSVLLYTTPRSVLA